MATVATQELWVSHTLRFHSLYVGYFLKHQFFYVPLFFCFVFMYFKYCVYVLCMWSLLPPNHFLPWRHKKCSWGLTQLSLDLTGELWMKIWVTKLWAKQGSFIWLSAARWNCIYICLEKIKQTKKKLLPFLARTIHTHANSCWKGAHHWCYFGAQEESCLFTQSHRLASSAAPEMLFMAWCRAWPRIPKFLSSLMVDLPMKPLQPTSTGQILASWFHPSRMKSLANVGWTDGGGSAFTFVRLVSSVDARHLRTWLCHQM